VETARLDWRMPKSLYHIWYSSPTFITPQFSVSPVAQVGSLNTGLDGLFVQLMPSVEVA
jgi:hypothetical protein